MPLDALSGEGPSALMQTSYRFGRRRRLRRRELAEKHSAWVGRRTRLGLVLYVEADDAHLLPPRIDNGERLQVVGEARADCHA